MPLSSPSEMTDKLEKTLRTTSKNKDQTNNLHTLGAIANIEPTTTQSLPYNGQQPEPPGGLKIFYWPKLLDVQMHKLLSLHRIIQKIKVLQEGEVH